MATDRQHIALKAPRHSIGVELGVANGGLTKRFLDLAHFSHFYAIDKWDDAGHSIHEYNQVVDRLGGRADLSIIRTEAQSWLASVPDGLLGFIYIDCYAHTGQDNGSILSAAWPKLAEGGLFAGDDYDRRVWKLTFNAVNRFAESVGKCVNVYDDHLRGDVSGRKLSQYDKSPSWWFNK